MYRRELILPVNYKRLVQVQLLVFLLLISAMLPSIFVSHQSSVVSVPALGHSHVASPDSEAYRYTHKHLSENRAEDLLSAPPTTHHTLIY